MRDTCDSMVSKMSPWIGAASSFTSLSLAIEKEACWCEKERMLRVLLILSVTWSSAWLDLLLCYVFFLLLFFFFIECDMEQCVVGFSSSNFKNISILLLCYVFIIIFLKKKTTKTSLTTINFSSFL